MKKISNLINIRNLIIVILCLTIIALGIGFAFLSIELEQKNDEKQIFNVSISSVKQNTSIKGGTISPNAVHTIATNKKTVTTSMNLYAPYDELSYTVTIENKGTIPAEIIDVIKTPDYQNDTIAQNELFPVEIKHLDIVGTIIEPGENIELNVVALYKPTINIIEKNVTYKLSIIAQSASKEE